MTEQELVHLIKSAVLERLRAEGIEVNGLPGAPTVVSGRPYPATPSADRFVPTCGIAPAFPGNLPRAGSIDPNTMNAFVAGREALLYHDLPEEIPAWAGSAQHLPAGAVSTRVDPGAVARGGAAGDPVLRDRSVLLVVSSPADQEGWDKLRALHALPYRFTLVPGAGLGADELSARVGPLSGGVRAALPANPYEFIRNYQLLVVPFLSVADLSRIALLLVEGAVPQAVFAALTEGVPVLAGGEAARFHAIAPQMSRGAGLVLHRHLETVKGFGVRMVEPGSLGEEITGALAGAAGLRGALSPSPGRAGRPVITKDDVWEAHRNHERKLHLPAGAIVTALARETAGQLDMEIILG